MSPTIAIASDHAGYALKQHLLEYLTGKDRTVLDLGPQDETSVDYPDYARLMADAIGEGRAEFGILICGTGIGISIAANRHRHIRAALCHDVTTARLSRAHNNANVLALGGRLIGKPVAEDCVDVFFATQFEGGRHQNRVEKLS